MSEYDPYDHPVDGYCPACGAEALYLWMGIPTCFQKGCPSPKMVGDLLADNEIHHVVRFDKSGYFNVKHPLRERVNNELLDCSIHSVINDLCEGVGMPGEGSWRLIGHGPVYIPGGPDQEGDWEWEEMSD